MQVFKIDDGARWVCVVATRSLTVGVELTEEVVGSGDWLVTGVEVRPAEGAVTVSSLRSAAYGDVIRRARAEVVKSAASRPKRIFARAGDPPAAFRSDRRGRSARTDEDYALLASAYLSMRPESRRQAAARWAKDFPEGGNRRTWINRLVRARQFVEGDYLTDEGMALVFGDDWQDRFDFDEKWDNALNVATMKPTDKMWRDIQRDGKDPRRWRAAAQRAIRVRVDDEGRVFPADSPQTPEERGE